MGAGMNGGSALHRQTPFQSRPPWHTEKRPCRLPQLSCWFAASIRLIEPKEKNALSSLGEPDFPLGRLMPFARAYVRTIVVAKCHSI